MTVPRIQFAAPLLAALALAACDSGPAPGPEASVAPSATTSPAATPVMPQGTPTPISASPPGAQAAALVPEAEKGEQGARNVLLAWAHALERGDYATAFAQWGAEAEARSGMTRAEQAEKWSQYKTITVAMPSGRMEGAAGSSYYTAPTTIVGKTQAGRPYRLEGDVILRRVNDVPGATADQLRWHIERVDLKRA